jgi:hypothetical protein
VKSTHLIYFRFLVVSFLILSFQASSQNTALVFGKITDAEGVPVENVTVSILGSPQPPTYTTAQGIFEYTIPANTELTLVFSSINYQQYQRKVRLQAGEKREINYSMVFKNTIGVVEVT